MDPSTQPRKRRRRQSLNCKEKKEDKYSGAQNDNATGADDSPNRKDTNLDRAVEMMPTTFATHPTKNSDEIGTKKTTGSGILSIAKTRLSKWCARLFDPDRPKGLIEPPKTIPLNDEYLQAFGRRQKEHYAAHGQDIQIEHTIEEEEGDADNDMVTGGTSSLEQSTNDRPKGTKVRIANLLFATTEASLTAACQSFGPIESVRLIMDRERPDSGLNKGLAFVTFTHADAAQDCMSGLNKIDGRTVKVSLAFESTSTTPAAKDGSQKRYWIRDISTKCYRCGQVGHMEAECTNPPLPKPCPLCAHTSHDMRDCPFKVVCFNCGVPGHTLRDCVRPRGIPPRRIDDYMARHSTGAAICMECHKPGHFLCREFKWFVGLQGGITCWNCGQRGHIGSQCARPDLEMCSRNESIVPEEIARADTHTTEDDVNHPPSRDRASRNNTARDMDSEHRQRARSYPPKRFMPAPQGSISSTPADYHRLRNEKRSR